MNGGAARTGPDRGDDGPLSTLDLHHLPDDKAVFACQKCSQVVVRDMTGPGSCARRSKADDARWAQALQDELMSKAFNGRNGRA